MSWHVQRRAAWLCWVRLGWAGLGLNYVWDCDQQRMQISVELPRLSTLPSSILSMSTSSWSGCCGGAQLAAAMRMSGISLVSSAEAANASSPPQSSPVGGNTESEEGEDQDEEDEYQDAEVPERTCTCEGSEYCCSEEGECHDQVS